MSSSMRKGSASLFESKAVEVYKGTLGEAWPSSIPRLPSALEGIIHTYSE